MAWSPALIIFGFLFHFAAAQASNPCGADVVDQVGRDATSVLQKCVESGEPVIELLPGRYYLDSTLDLGARSNLKIRTRGVSSGAPCLASGAAPCAILTASARNPGPVLFKSAGAKNLTLQYIALDGNIAQRRASLTNQQWPPGTAYNAKIHSCTACRFEGFASIRAPQGTGLEFWGDDAVFERVLFRDNGWGYPTDPSGKITRFADGLTVISSARLRIAHSFFLDNSDIDLIIGNAPDAVIENNLIGNTYNFAFGALMLDNFNGTAAGDFTGAVIRNNKIICGEGMCGIGINVGPHMWYKSRHVIGGRITGNTVSGAKQGILTNGATGAEIDHNTVERVIPYAIKSCATSAIADSPGDTVKIHDNNLPFGTSRLQGCYPQDLAVAPAALVDVDLRVAQAYREILARNPDAEGGRYFSQALENGASISAVRDWLARSPEAATVRDRFFRRTLGRAADPSGLETWVNFQKGGGNLSQLYMFLQISPEGLAKSNQFEDWSDF